jgi:hypothetical protein
VNARWAEFGRASVSRRTLAKQLAGAFLAVAAGAGAARTGVPRTLYGEATGALTRNRPIPPQPKPVVSFFLDQPYLDPSGLGEPYLPPQGLRGGEPLARLTEGELRHNAPYGWALDQNG